MKAFWISQALWAVTAFCFWKAYRAAKRERDKAWKDAEEWRDLACEYKDTIDGAAFSPLPSDTR